MSQLALQAQVRTESIVSPESAPASHPPSHARPAAQAYPPPPPQISASHSLLSLSHSLKLLHLFNDTHTPTAARERIAAELAAEVGRAEGEVKDLVKAAGRRSQGVEREEVAA